MIHSREAKTRAIIIDLPIDRVDRSIGRHCIPPATSSTDQSCVSRPDKEEGTSPPFIETPRSFTTFHGVWKEKLTTD